MADELSGTVEDGEPKPEPKPESESKPGPGLGRDPKLDPDRPEVVPIAPRGDVVLDVLFVTSAETLRQERRRPRGQGVTSEAHRHSQSRSRRRSRVAFRVDAAVLKKHSRYFAKLLGDTRFPEARAVEAALAALALESDGTGGSVASPSDVEAVRLPWVQIEDGDEGSHAAGREVIFAELLRILHDSDKTSVKPPARLAEATRPTAIQQPTQAARPTARKQPAKPVKLPATQTAPKKTRHPGSVAAPAPSTAPAAAAAATPPPLLTGKPLTLRDLAMLALLADRFQCTAAVAAYVSALRFRFPAAEKGLVSGGGGSGPGSGMGPLGLPGLANEEAVRQKIFVAWLLDQPQRFQAGTRELILYGSRRWKDAEADEDEAVWWDLPDDIENELYFRRACILACLASLPRHFIGLYMSRTRQCQMGYGSSVACDSFQLGEMVKFFLQKQLLFLQDMGMATEPEPEPDAPRFSAYAAVDVYHILATLRQCPAYQLDAHHVNCGLRTRLLPCLDYVHAMLSANSLALSRRDWASSAGRASASWAGAGADDGRDDGDGDGDGNDCGDSGYTNGHGVIPGPSHSRQHVFRFTRAVAGDQRLRYADNMAANSLARRLFTASHWDWTPQV